MKEETGTLSLRSPDEAEQRYASDRFLGWANSIVPLKGKFLDIGAADGWTVEYIEQNKECKGTGVSIDKEDIRLMKQFNVDCIEADACNIPLPNEEYDFIYTRQTLEHVDSPFIALKEIRRLLKDGGHAYVSVPEYNMKYQQCLMHKYVLPSECWKTLFSRAGFELIAEAEFYHIESEYCFIIKKGEDK